MDGARPEPGAAAHWWFVASVRDSLGFFIGNASNLYWYHCGIEWWQYPRIEDLMNLMYHAMSYLQWTLVEILDAQTVFFETTRLWELPCVSCPARYCRTPSGITFPEKIYLKASIPDYQRLLYDQVTDTTTKKQACKGKTYDNTIYIIYIYMIYIYIHIYILQIHTEKLCYLAWQGSHDHEICNIIVIITYMDIYTINVISLPIHQYIIILHISCQGWTCFIVWLLPGVLMFPRKRQRAGSFRGWTLCLHLVRRISSSLDINNPL